MAPVSEGEYGDAFEMNADNTLTWAELAPLSSPITYRFAWSEKGLYVAISYADSLEDASQIQINCNPGGQLSADQQGLFVTIQPSGTVLLHNHSTALASLEGDATQADVTSKVTVASASADGIKTTEVFLPIDAFRITNTDFTFSAGRNGLLCVCRNHEGRRCCRGCCCHFRRAYGLEYRNAGLRNADA